MKHKHKFILSHQSNESDGYSANYIDYAYVICENCGEVKKLLIKSHNENL